MTHVQDLQPMTYITIFVIAGVAWVALMILVVGLWIGFNKLITPTPKPTNWENEWEKIEDNLSN